MCSPESPRSHPHWPTQPHGAPAASGMQQPARGGNSPPDGGSGHATPGHHSRSGTPDLPSGSGGGGAPSAAYASLPAPPRSPFAAQMGQRQTQGDAGRALLSQLSFPRLAAGAWGEVAATPLPFMRRGRHAAAGAAVAEHPNIIGRIDSTDGSSVHGPPCGAGFVYPDDDAAPVSAAHFTGLPRHAPEADAIASADAVRIRLSRSMPRLSLAAGAALPTHGGLRGGAAADASLRIGSSPGVLPGLGAARRSVTGDRCGSAEGIEVLPEAQVQSSF